MQKFYGLVVVAGALILTGCGKEQEPSTPATATAPAISTNTPGGYVGTMLKSQQVAVKAVDTAALNQEVTLFQAQEGRLPTNLNELVQKQYLGKLPEPPIGMKLQYDAVAGKVTVVPQ